MALGIPWRSAMQHAGKGELEFGKSRNSEIPLWKLELWCGTILCGPPAASTQSSIDVRRSIQILIICGSSSRLSSWPTTDKTTTQAAVSNTNTAPSYYENRHLPAVRLIQRSSTLGVREFSEKTPYGQIRFLLLTTAFQTNYEAFLQNCPPTQAVFLIDYPTASYLSWLTSW